MFWRVLSDDELKISLAMPQDAPLVFQAIENNRQHLRRWLPWVDAATEESHTHAFLEDQLNRFANGNALTVLILDQNQFVGIASYHTIDVINRCGAIGYWLCEASMGRGLMTKAVRELISLGQQYYALQRVEIRCATGNQRSRAIPERLGFSHEGTLRRAEKLRETFLDMEVYGLLL